MLSPAILSEITPASQRGAVLAINSAVGTSAGIIAPYLMGSVIEGAASAAQGYSNGFTICGLVTLVGGLIGLIFLRPERSGSDSRRVRTQEPSLRLLKRPIKPYLGLPGNTDHMVRQIDTKETICRELPMLSKMERGMKSNCRKDFGDAGSGSNGVPGIDGDCGGECACGTCHVYVDCSWLDRLDAIGEAEASMLSFAEARNRIRGLPARSKCRATLDGLVVGLPEGQH